MKPENHKKIEFPLPPGFPQEAKEIVAAAFSKFKKDQVFHEFRGAKLTVHLHAMDLEAFREAAASVACKDGEGAPAAALLNQVADAIENIRSYGIKGRQRVYVGYNKERKVKQRKAKEQNRSQHWYARDHGFSEENQEIPAEFEDAVICGDSLDVLPRLPDNCVDMIFTSPPYNFGLDYESNDDAGHWEEYFGQLYAVLDECVRVLKFGGRIAVNIQPLFSDYIPSHHLVSAYLMGKKLIWKGEILWEKNNYNCKYTAWGSWKSPSNPYLKYTWEFIEVFCKGSMKKAGSREDADLTADEFKKWVVSKWSIAPERDMQKYGHPAMFPEELAKRVIKLFSFRGDVVLDPFNGVGTTTLVAKMLGRRFLGVDVSDAYCETAEARMR